MKRLSRLSESKKQKERNSFMKLSRSWVTSTNLRIKKAFYLMEETSPNNSHLKKIVNRLKRVRKEPRKLCRKLATKSVKLLKLLMKVTLKKHNLWISSMKKKNTSVWMTLLILNMKRKASKSVAFEPHLLTMWSFYHLTTRWNINSF